MRHLLLLVAPAALLAQNATLSGKVTDANQNVVTDAGITALRLDNGTERAVRSNNMGQYALPALVPGRYKLTVEARGYLTRTMENVVLQPDQNARLDIVVQSAAGSIHGQVVDGSTGEALAGVRIQMAGTDTRIASDTSGQFQIDGLAVGEYLLTVSTVGYHLEKHSLHLDPGESAEVKVILTPDNMRQTETVQAKLDPFEPLHGDAPSVVALSGNDSKNLGTVFANDPLRAVQALPGVSSDRDFDARFSLRGADFSRIGLYLDGILLHDPFHEAKAASFVAGTVSAFNGNLIEEMDLYDAAFPARFEDRTAGALEISTRDGSATDYHFSAGASTTLTEFLAEGPFRNRQHKPKGSWIVAARKSYLQYVFEVLGAKSQPVFNMEDLEARGRYDFSAKNTVTFSVLESLSKLDQSGKLSRLGINEPLFGHFDYSLATLGWHYSPDSKLTIVSHAAWMREKSNDTNTSAQLLDDAYYGEWVANTTATWNWNEQDPLQVGWSFRRVRSQSVTNFFGAAVGDLNIADHADGTAVQTGGFAQQSWTLLSGHVHLTAGTRWDYNSVDRVPALSPQASAAIGLTRALRLQLGWAQYAEYPEISVFRSQFGNANLLPMRSIHATAALEQRLGDRTRLRLEYYNRDDRDMPFQPFYDPRILNGQIFNPPANPLYYNSLRGHSRGAEIFLQRSSANRLTGWVSYSYGRTTSYEGVTQQQFPSDYDQRHTVNVYGSLRVSPTVNLSLHSAYGSGFPIPEYVMYGSHGGYYLSASPNQLRLPAYQRTDLRLNKSWIHARWKFTLFGEIVNLTNHSNYYYENYNSYYPATGQVFMAIPKTFPILPTVGLSVEW